MNELYLGIALSLVNIGLALYNDCYQVQWVELLRALIAAITLYLVLRGLGKK